MQSRVVNSVEAAEQLQIIRTLMERAALYRRALGPTLVGVGTLGVVASVGGVVLGIGTERAHGFVLYWTAVALVALTGAVLRVRKQALGDCEPFWTPPTRRVVVAMAPALVVAVGLTALLTLQFGGLHKVVAATLPPVWMALYGVALHAAGHFTLRGIRWLGWGFIGAAFVLGAWGTAYSLVRADVPTLVQAHLAMGLTFGAGHLLAGAWIQMAERRGTP
jgi:hypothetical protein